MKIKKNDYEHTTIKELPKLERPYEKLERYGANILTDAELLAIVLRTGTRNKTSIATARQVLSLHKRGLGGIHVLTTKELQQVDGVGRVKSIQLKALAEISSRMAKSNAISNYRITSPKSVANIYMEEMRYLEKEKILAVFLDNKNGIIGDRTISLGTVNASLVDPREVFKEALEFKAVNIILLHNHPSGDPTPSPDDCDVTKRIIKAGKVIGIELIDHIVIGDGKYCSLKEQSLCDF